MNSTCFTNFNHNEIGHCLRTKGFPIFYCKDEHDCNGLNIINNSTPPHLLSQKIQNKLNSPLLDLLSKSTEKIETLIRQNKHLAANINILQQQNLRLKQFSQTLQSQLKCANQGNQFLQWQLQTKQVALNKVEKQYQQLMQVLRHGKTKVQNMFSNCRQENVYLRAQTISLKKKYIEKADQFQKLNQEYNLLKEENEKVQKQAQGLRVYFQDNQKEKFLVQTYNPQKQKRLMWEQKYLELVEMLNHIGVLKKDFLNRKKNQKLLERDQIELEMQEKQNKWKRVHQILGDIYSKQEGTENTFFIEKQGDCNQQAQALSRVKSSPLFELKQQKTHESERLAKKDNNFTFRRAL